MAGSTGGPPVTCRQGWRPMSRARGHCALALLGGWFLAGITQAAPSTTTWSGLGVDNNWGNFRNWTNAETPPPNDGTASIVFAGRRRVAPFVNVPWSIASLSFDNTADAFTIAGSALTIGSGGVTNSSSISETINSAINLNSPQIWNASAGPLSFGGAINTNGNTLTFAGDFNTTVSAVISNSGGLVK